MTSMPVPARDESNPDIPRLTEGASTVGLMLWPGKQGELIITGFKEDSSAADTELAIGDVIMSVDGDSVEGMDATDVAAMMAGPTGSVLSITTLSGVICEVTRDVSADEANATTVDSVSKSTPAKPLTDMECMRYGVPRGSSWTTASKPALKSARSTPAPSPAPSPAKNYSATPAQEGRLLTQTECFNYGVPLGSRMKAAPAKKAPEPKREPEPEPEALERFEDEGHLL